MNSTSVQEKSLFEDWYWRGGICGTTKADGTVGLPHKQEYIKLSI
jgi:hypothetical protein